MIRTVLGDIPAEGLGVTMIHEHLSMDLSPVRGDSDSVFRDRGLLVPELQKMADSGVSAVVEVSTIDMGRDVSALKTYAVETGLQVVAATGFYLQPYHPAFLKEAPVEEIAALFQRELIQGIDDTGICAGVIGEVATSRNLMMQEERKVLMAAGLAAAQTGFAVSTHCDMGTLALEQARLLKKYMRADKIILGHLDLVDDTDYHLRLLEEGVNIAFDTIGKTAYVSDERRADLLCALLKQGYASQLLLSQDVSRVSYLMANGGQGYTAVMQGFLPLLRERSVSAKDIQAMLVVNPARILDRE